MNILSFDIEEWYLNKVSFGDVSHRYGQYDKLLQDILHVLDMQETKATFFCVGGMAEYFPEVVKEIDKRGHEVGCHSHRHTWLNKLSKDEVIEDTHRAVSALEQCIGKKVISYRAPAFSIGEENKWAFEILHSHGIERDASVFPAKRDFGGFPTFGESEPCIISVDGIIIKEFPVSPIKMLGQEIVYSGGGYFRFFPLSFIKNKISKSDYTMTYFHIGDLIHENNGVMSKQEYEEYFKQPGTLINRYKRYIKKNIGTKGAFNKLTALIESTDFHDLNRADSQIDWEGARVVEV